MRNFCFNRMITAVAGAALVCGLAVVPAAASAATPAEAEAAARACGIPEEDIQAAWNQFYADPEKYTPELIDEMIEQLYIAKGRIVTNVPYNPDAVIPALTESAPASSETVTTAAAPSGDTQQTDPSPQAPEATDAPAPAAPSGGNSTGNGNNGGAATDPDITLTMPDGTTFTRISTKRFIALSYEDKLTYLGTFTPAQQSVLIENLTPEEYRSLLKQLPSDQKLEVIDTLSGITDDLGLTITVDELTDDSAKISLRDENGELKGVAEAGKLVADTGYDRRGFFALCGALIAAAFGGLAVLVHSCFTEEITEDER